MKYKKAAHAAAKTTITYHGVMANREDILRGAESIAYHPTNCESTRRCKDKRPYRVSNGCVVILTSRDAAGEPSYFRTVKPSFHVLGVHVGGNRYAIAFQSTERKRIVV